MRRHFLLVCSALLFVATIARASGTKVVFFGDSITAGDGTNDFVSRVAALRPDLTVLNRGKAGDVTENRSRFAAMLTADKPNIVVILLGTNDPVCYAMAVPIPECRSEIATPQRAAINLVGMARAAVAAGADVYVMTPTPVRCIAGAPCDDDPAVAARFRVRQSFTDRLAEEMFKWPRRDRIHLENLRGQFTSENWPSLTLDGLHPNAAGHNLIAAYVAAFLPRVP